MNKNVEYTKKNLIQENEMRDTILMLDGKIQATEGYESIKTLLRMYFPNTPAGFEKLEKLDRMMENMEEDWLVKVWIDENNIFRSLDIATTDNWIVERANLKIAKLKEAFGGTDEIYKEDK